MTIFFADVCSQSDTPASFSGFPAFHPRRRRRQQERGQRHLVRLIQTDLPPITVVSGFAVGLHPLLNGGIRSYQTAREHSMSQLGLQRLLNADPHIHRYPRRQPEAASDHKPATTTPPIAVLDHRHSTQSNRGRFRSCKHRPGQRHRRPHPEFCQRAAASVI
jgi:hypothetical protein